MRDDVSYRKAPLIIGIILMTLAASGYFMGLQQTTSTLKMTEPTRVIIPESAWRATFVSGAIPVAVAYSNQNWLRDGPNATWSQDLSKLVQPVPMMAASTNVSESDRAKAIASRAERRAFPGAPPLIPHVISQESSAVCLSCHAKGLAIRERFASRISHTAYASCTQCHVPAQGATWMTAEQGGALLHPIAENAFTPLTAPLRGKRAWPGAPPTIPHPTFMRSECLSCHGPTGLAALRTSHPERQSCRQCHVSDATSDEVQVAKGDR